MVIWLQGGPGSSSLFGLFEIHGPISAVFDSNGDTIGVLNEYAWTSQANMIYIDNPVGAGINKRLSSQSIYLVQTYFVYYRLQLCRS